MRLFIKLTALLLILMGTVDAEIVRRAAFDFGSGNIRVQVADVDAESCEIVQSLYRDNINILLNEDLALQDNGCFCQEIQDLAITETRALLKKAISLGATEFAGIATAAYRQAGNGQDLIDRYVEELGISVRIVSQEEEGQFGFATLVAEHHIPPDGLVAWDIGAGSFQITFLDAKGNLLSYMGPYGRSTTKDAVIQYVKKQDLKNTRSPNPISSQDWDASLAHLHSALPVVPKALLAKLKQPGTKLIGIGGHPPLFKARGGYDLKKLQDLASHFQDKTDEQLKPEHPFPDFAVTELALIQVILEKLDADEVACLRTAGTTSGVLVAPREWESILPQSR